MSAAVPLRANRRLKRVRALAEHVHAATEAAGLKTCREVLELGEIELVDRAGIYLDEARELVDAVSAAVAPKPRSALELLLTKRDGPSNLRTGLLPLDRHLGGGLPVRSVTEAVGPAGIGKSQLCLAVAARALVDGEADGRRVVFVDTERSLDAGRLLQLLQQLLARRAADAADDGGGGAPPVSAEELASRVRVFRPDAWDGYCAALAELETTVLSQPARVSLVVVDSVAAPVRAHFGATKEHLLARQECLLSHAALLKQLAEEHTLAVLVTNQVQAEARGDGPPSGQAPTQGVGAIVGRDDAALAACLGIVWTHSVNTRLVLQRQPSTAPLPLFDPEGLAQPPEPREIRIAKSPMCAATVFGYSVGHQGLCEAECYQ